jgi:glycyl-tRNA synthetase beta chain
LNEQIITGPPADRAFKDGEPTKAAIGFARGKGVDVSALQIMDGPRGPVVGVKVQTGGESTIDLIQSGLEQAILKIDYEKSMRWGSSPISWARPIHRIIALFGSDLISCEVAGIQSSKVDVGHRLKPDAFEITSVDQWVNSLQDRFIIVDREDRLSRCTEQLKTLSASLGAEIRDWDLLDEVVDLVEWPNTIRCEFPADLLDLPPRLLVEAMKLHQRVFPLYHADTGALRSDFLVVTNHPYAQEPDVAATIAEGNKRVLTARFYDAKFFFAEDRKRTLLEHGAKLEKMRWVRKGGMMSDKVQRLEQLSTEWASVFNANPKHVHRAATLCKCDLATQMVYEFTDLQGHVGRLLARFDGEDPAVCTAIEEHYLPRGSDDELPSIPEGAALAFIDRLDSLQECFKLGLQPKGSSDPLGLRRAANGLVSLLLQHNRAMSLSSFLNGDLLTFVLARLKSQFQDEFGGEITNAVLATGLDCPVSLHQRMIAMQTLSQSSDFAELRATFKRVMGLTKDHTDTNLTNVSWVDPTEEALADAYHNITTVVSNHLHTQNITAALESLSSLKPFVDALFDSVMVMDENLEIRHNRLSLLRAIANDFKQIADFTILSA